MKTKYVTALKNMRARQMFTHAKLNWPIIKFFCYFDVPRLSIFKTRLSTEKEFFPKIMIDQKNVQVNGFPFMG